MELIPSFYLYFLFFVAYYFTNNSILRVAFGLVNIYLYIYEHTFIDYIYL